MNNKKHLNGKYIDKFTDGHSSLAELNIDNKKEIIHMINNKNFFTKWKNKFNKNNSMAKKNNIVKNIKENALLNMTKKDKSRTIMQKITKEKDNYLYGNYVKNIRPGKCGNVYCFFYVEKYPLFTIGPQFIYPIILLLINNILFILSIKYILNNFHYIFRIVEILLFAILDFSQLYTTLINEGIPKRKWFLSNRIINCLIEDEYFYNEFNINKYQICRKCNILIDKSLKIIHCDICNLCCEFYDHHCPWIGKCIGKNNYYSFKIYVFSNIIFIFYNMVLIFIFIIKK